MTGLAFAGVHTALVTPFKGGAVDEAAFVRLVERQIAAGVDGLVVASAAAGEAPTLTPKEWSRLIALAVSASAGRAPVIAGAASNATSQAMDRIRAAADLGAAAALVETPWYNRPSQDGLCRHYLHLAEMAPLPLIIGLAPLRARADLTPQSLARLSQAPRLIGVADASPEPARVSAVRQTCGPAWTQLAADDASALGHWAHGGHGCISLTANIAPAAVCAFHRSWLAQDLDQALKWQDRLHTLHPILALDPVPANIKQALALMELCEPEVRLPITPCPAATAQTLAEVLRTYLHLSPGCEA